ncbi:MAG: hypothetical protein LBE18_04610, partial [Planctomycetaceae bacterium]|nr:hypothetical protein [Planctomycetaceae bacterium]
MSYRLTKEQIRKLKKQYYKNCGHRFVNRNRIVLAFDHGYKVSDLALIFMLDCDTIRRYFHLYKEGGINGLVEKYRKKLGKIKFVFLPPYSPNLNTAQNGVTTVNHSESWNFDKTGNWSQYVKNSVTENRTHNAANELQGIANHDATGNIVLMPGLKGKYDAWNRLVEVRDSNDNLIAQYEYNGLNQRIKKT